MSTPSRGSTAILIVVIGAMGISGCLFRKKKAAAPEVPLAPARVVLLPANIPPENSELRWVSLATTILMAKQMEDAQDLEVVPLWESMPVALEALGASRNITGETPAYVASRLNARWATQIELTSSKGGVDLLLDFMPTKANMIAYRFHKEVSIDSLHSALREAIEQFLRYLQARPLAKGGKASKTVESKELRAIAEAMDREYGWFSPADPGKVSSTRANLTRSDGRLARLLFKPAPSPESEVRPATPSSEGPVPSPGTGPPTTQTAPVDSGPPPTIAPPKSSQQSATTGTRPAEVLQPLPAAEIIESTRAPSARPHRSPGVGASDAPSRQPAPHRPTVGQKQSEPLKDGEIDRANPELVRQEPSPPRKYWIQVISTRIKVEADAQAEKLGKAGFPAEVIQVDLKERGLWYRVRIQGYDTRRAAEEAAKRLVADGVITEYWVVP